MDTAIKQEIDRFLEKKPFHFAKRIKQDKEGNSFIIAFLYKRKDEIVYSGDIAKETCVSTARIAASVNKLEELGYITRKTSKLDARKTQIKLTNKGLNRAKQLEDELYSFLEKLINELGIDKFRQFMSLSSEINECVVKILQGGD